MINTGNVQIRIIHSAGIAEIVNLYKSAGWWEESYKGKPVQMDVYNYRIEATDKASKERKMYNGRVTVVK